VPFSLISWIYVLLLSVFSAPLWADNLVLDHLKAQVAVGPVQGLFQHQHTLHNPTPSFLVGFSSPYFSNPSWDITLETHAQFTQFKPTAHDFKLYWVEARGGYGFFPKNITTAGFGADLAIDIVKAPKAPEDYQFFSSETDYGAVLWIQSPSVKWNRVHFHTRLNWHTAFTQPQTSQFISALLFGEFEVF
jgi:hypothetical protein